MRKEFTAILKREDDWYIAYHRFGMPGGDGTHRETTIDRLHFNADGTIKKVVPTLESIDPLTYAAAARGKRILMLNATNDEVIPRACTESLWKALGEPEIRWYAGGHYSVIRFLFGALLRVGRFFADS